MIEVYRDRLKLDVMVINAFNQILNIQPTNTEAGDALAAQYETMKRWPDLISLLRKKAGAAETTADKVALHLKVANLFLEKFSNQAEAIKAYETILELDPQNTEALAFLKQMYEKRRDWEKLVAVTQREIDLSTDEEAKKLRRVEVAKLASEKLKKPSVSIELWKQVLAGDAENAEALAELEKLYEREKAWGDLGDVLNRQVALSSDATKKSALLVKLGILYTEKVQDAAKATSAWQALLQQEPDNRRAQDALKKLYLVAKDWNALESFYAAQNKWDELVRVLERQAETDDGPAAVSLWNKIGELYRDRLTKPDRAQKAFEKALATDGQNLAAAEALIPSTRRARTCVASPRRSWSSSTTRPTSTSATPASSGSRSSSRSTRATRGRRCRSRSSRSRRTRSTRGRSRRRVASAARAVAGPSWPRPTRRRSPRFVTRRRRCRCSRRSRTPTRRSSRRPTRPSRATRRSSRRSPRIPRRSRRSSACTSRRGASPTARDLRQEARARQEQGGGLDIRFKLAGLYEDEIKQPDKAIELYEAILKQDPQQLRGARGARPHLPGLGRWTELRATIGAGDRARRPGRRSPS
jgi:tetratricopeptide (TPR) repeat protein